MKIFLTMLLIVTNLFWIFCSYGLYKEIERLNDKNFQLRIKNLTHYKDS